MELEKSNGKTYMDLETVETVGVTMTTGDKVKKFLKENILILLLIIALALGVGIGAGLRELDPPLDDRQKLYLKFPGDILMNMLNLLILPLIVSSLISGLTALDGKASGKMGGLAVAYYLITTFAAVVLGIILVVAIGPGYRGGNVAKTGSSKVVNTADTFLDLIRQMFPSNIVQACFSKFVTTQTWVNEEEIVNATLALNGTTNDTSGIPERLYEPIIEQRSGMNVLGIVVFSIFVGIFIGKMGERGKPLKDFFEALSELTMRLILLVIWYSPIGIIFLVAHKVVDMDNPERTFKQLLFYFVTVMSGLFAHGFVTLPLVYFAFVRRNPFKYVYGVAQALFTALGTGSSSATLPITMRCLEENNGVDPRVTKFVAPVGATINMDGTALYEAVAVIFIGQMQGYDLSIGQIIIISITATTAAIGAAGVPQAGLVTMVIVLTAVGFPTEDVTIILAIDWLLDRFRTAINVLGDAFGAGIVAHLARRELRAMDEEERRYALDQSNGYINSTFENERL